MDHSRAPVLEAVQEFRRRGDVVLGPPGHEQGRGTDPRVLESVTTPRHASSPRRAGAGRRGGPPGGRRAGPCPPGVPVLAPGERITREIVDHLTTGVAAGMLVPDAADPELKSLRVVAE